MASFVRLVGGSCGLVVRLAGGGPGLVVRLAGGSCGLVYALRRRPWPRRTPCRRGDADYGLVVRLAGGEPWPRRTPARRRLWPRRTPCGGGCGHLVASSYALAAADVASSYALRAADMASYASGRRWPRRRLGAAAVLAPAANVRLARRRELWPRRAPCGRRTMASSYALRAAAMASSYALAAAVVASWVLAVVIPPW